MNNPCPYCSSRDIVKEGVRLRKKYGKVQEYRCKECGSFWSTHPDGSLAVVPRQWTRAEEEILSQYAVTNKSMYRIYHELNNAGFDRSYASVQMKISRMGLTKPGKYITGHEERLGYLDIESTGLKADIDIMLSWVIKERDKNNFYSDVVCKNDLFMGWYDRHICESLCDVLKRFDLIFTFYGTNFDIKFIKTRCIDHRLDFPLYREVSHKDLYYMVKRVLKLHSSSLGSACQFLGIDGKSHFDPRLWRDARYGDPESLAKVLDHNKHDVIILEKMHLELEKYYAPTVQPM